MPYTLRSMDWGDVEQVAEIERDAFPTLWPPTSYRRELRNDRAQYTVCVSSGEYVAQLPGPPRRGWLDAVLRRRRVVDTNPVQRERIVGFVGQWFMAGEAHIVSIAVQKEYRRRGLGELLLIGAIEMAMRQDQEMVTLEVRASNTPARNLYEKYGFRQAGLRRGYYSDDHEDAVLMSTDNLRAPEFQELLDRIRTEFTERYGEAQRPVL